MIDKIDYVLIEIKKIKEFLYMQWQNYIKKTISGTNIFVQFGFTMVEIILIATVIYWSKHYINILYPTFLQDKGNFYLIISHIKTYNYTLETTKIWAYYISTTIGLGCILIFLYLWFVLGIVGALSLVKRLIQKANTLFK